MKAEVGVQEEEVEVGCLLLVAGQSRLSHFLMLTNQRRTNVATRYLNINWHEYDYNSNFEMHISSNQIH